MVDTPAVLRMLLLLVDKKTGTSNCDENRGLDDVFEPQKAPKATAKHFMAAVDNFAEHLAIASIHR